MTKFRYRDAECQCIDASTNSRVLALDSENPGVVYAYLTPEDAFDLMEQFQRRGILPQDQIKGDGRRLAGVTFVAELGELVDKMLDAGFSDDPERQICDWLAILQRCSHRLSEHLCTLRNWRPK